MTTPTPQQRKKTAHAVEVAATTTAGVAGSGFGAAKLRDSHREQYPRQHTAGVKHAVKLARSRGATPQQAARVARILSDPHVKPGFKSLATASAAAGVAGLARKYQGIQSLRQRKHDAQRTGVTKSDWGAEVENLPRYGHIKGVGRVRVLGYRGDGHFHVLAPDDSTRIVHRDRITFQRAKKATMTKSAFGVEHVSKSDSRRRGAQAAAGVSGALTTGAAVAGGRAVHASGRASGLGQAGRDAARTGTHMHEAQRSHYETARQYRREGGNVNNQIADAVSREGRNYMHQANGAHAASHSILHEVKPAKLVARRQGKLAVGLAAGGLAAGTASSALRRRNVTKSAFGVEHISKGLFNPNAAKRGAQSAHLMIAGKYEAANKGKPGAVTAAAGTRYKPATARRRMRLNEVRGENAGNASFHREQAAKLSKGRLMRDLGIGAGAGITGAALASPQVATQLGATAKKVAKPITMFTGVGKAYDSERSRHRRQAAYEGTAAGGAVVAGASAVQGAKRARKLGAEASLERGHETAAHATVTQNLHRMSQPTASQGSLGRTESNMSSTSRHQRAALGHKVEAARLSDKASVARKFARGKAGVAIGLAGVAAGVHRTDRARGRSYGYR